MVPKPHSLSWLSLPVADALVTSCPWGCSTVVSATSTTQGEGGLKRGGTYNIDTLRSADVMRSGPQEVHFATPELL